MSYNESAGDEMLSSDPIVNGSSAPTSATSGTATSSSGASIDSASNVATAGPGVQSPGAANGRPVDSNGSDSGRSTDSAGGCTFVSHLNLNAAGDQQQLSVDPQQQHQQQSTMSPIPAQHHIHLAHHQQDHYVKKEDAVNPFSSSCLYSLDPHQGVKQEDAVGLGVGLCPASSMYTSVSSQVLRQHTLD